MSCNFGLSRWNEDRNTRNKHRWTDDTCMTIHKTAWNIVKGSHSDTQTKLQSGFIPSRWHSSLLACWRGTVHDRHDLYKKYPLRTRRELHDIPTLVFWWLDPNKQITNPQGFFGYKQTEAPHRTTFPPLEDWRTPCCCKENPNTSAIVEPKCFSSNVGSWDAASARIVPNQEMHLTKVVSARKRSSLFSISRPGSQGTSKAPWDRWIDDCRSAGSDRNYKRKSHHPRKHPANHTFVMAIGSLRWFSNGHLH